MIPFGNVPAGSVLPVFFDSYAGSTGASITITGLAVTDIEIYKGTSVTQRASDAGYVLMDTDGIDFDAITGIHGFSIDTGDNTDVGFYAVGSFFTVVVSAITVDSQTVNFVAATFRIVAAEGTAGTPVADATRWNNLPTVALPLIPTTAGRTLDVSAGGEAGIDWANIGSPTTAVNLSATNIDVDQIVASVSGAVGSVTAGVTVTTNNDKTGYALSATGSAAMTESYAADGAAPTLGQFQYMIWSLLAERTISGTTLSALKLDGATTAMTFTLDSAANPAAQTRAT